MASTRRTLLGQLGWLWAACAQTPPDKSGNALGTLRPGHPRLVATDADLERIRNLARENAQARKILGELQKEADRLQTVAPVEYKLIGPRLLAQSRRAVERIYTLALVYRLDGKKQHLDRAVRELHSAAAFKDWNPSYFLDVAEMTHAFAIGYDWLYAGLNPDERAWIKQSILEKGLNQAMPLYEHQSAWVTTRNNWNIVCNGGIGLGALAVADEEPEKAAAILRYAIDSIAHGMSAYGPDGGWSEGPAYWHYATRYAAIFLAGLDSALGNDFGISNARGFDKAGRFRIYFTDPSARVFNYADSADDAGEAAEMFWLARRFAQPVFAWQEQRQLEKAPRPDALDLIWYQRDAKPPQGPSWPLDAIFQGVHVALFRGAWDDPNALYLAVKGGDNKAGHAHLDLGSFVFCAGGIRWAHDLGPDDYNLPGYFSRQRWSYYRMRTEAHNTLLIDGESQDPRAEAHIVRHEFAPDFAWVEIDLTRAYPGKVQQMYRRIGLAQRQSVLVQDVLKSGQPVDALWGMITDAEVTVDGQNAELQKEGWTLSAEIRTPRHAIFDIVPVKTAAPQAQNPGMRKLVVRLGDKVNDLDLNIVLTPHRTGQPKPKTTAKFPAT